MSVKLSQSVPNGIAGSHAQRDRSRRSQTAQALDNQRVMREIVTSKTARDLDRINAVRAWDTMSDRLRVLQNKPLPGQLQPDKEKARAKRRSGRVIAAITPEQIAQSMADPSQGVA